MQSQLEQTIDDLWELHDEAKKAGNTAEADGYALRAFQLIERLPQNEIYLKTVH